MKEKIKTMLMILSAILDITFIGILLVMPFFYSKDLGYILLLYFVYAVFKEKRQTK